MCGNFNEKDDDDNRIKNKDIAGDSAEIGGGWANEDGCQDTVATSADAEDGSGACKTYKDRAKWAWKGKKIFCTCLVPLKLLRLKSRPNVLVKKIS